MANNPEQVSNTPETKYEKIKKLLDKGGSLKDGIKDDKGNIQIAIKGNQILLLNSVYILNISKFGIQANLEDIIIKNDTVTIKTDKQDGEIKKSDFFNVINSCINNGKYCDDIDGKHIEVTKIADIDRANNQSKIAENKKMRNKAEINGNTNSELALLFTQAQEKASSNPETANIMKQINENPVVGLEQQMGTFAKIGEKISGIFDALMKGFDLILEGKFTEGFAAIMAGFTGKKEEEKKGGNEADDEGVSETANKDLKYTLGVKTLNMIKGHKTEEYTLSILTQKEIKNRTFTEINEIYKKGEKGISNNLGLIGKGSDKQIYTSLKLIIDNSDLINKTFYKTNPNWKDSKLIDLLPKIGSKGTIINNITDRIKKMDLSINPVKALSQISNNGIFNGISKNEKGEIVFGDFEERKNLLEPLKKDTILQLIRLNDKLKYSSDIQLQNRLHSYVETQEEKDSIDKILKFSKDIIPSLSNIFPEKKDNYLKFFNTNGISIKDTMELYMITGGETNLNNLDGVSKSIIYLKLGDILGHGEFRGENFDKVLLDKLAKNEIPEDVKNILGKMLSTVSASMVDGILGAGKEIWGTLTPIQITGIAIRSGLVIAGMVAIAPYALARSVVGGVTIVATAAIAITRIIMNNNKNLNEKQVNKIVKEQIKKISGQS